MSSNYHCDLDTETSLDDILSRVHGLVGGAVEKEPNGRPLITTAGLVVSVRRIENTQRREWAMADWGVYPRTTVSFGLIRFVSREDTLSARRALSIASVQLGEDLDTDAILLFEMDRAMMRRKAGVVTLYDWWPEWSVPQVLTALPPGYTLTRDREEPRHDNASQ